MGDGSLDVEVRPVPGRLSERMARTSLWDMTTIDK